MLLLCITVTAMETSYQKQLILWRVSWLQESLSWNPTFVHLIKNAKPWKLDSNSTTTWNVSSRKKIQNISDFVNNISYLGNTKMLLLMSAKRITKLSLSKVHLNWVWICGSCCTANFQVLIFLVEISIDKDATLLFN